MYGLHCIDRSFESITEVLYRRSKQPGTHTAEEVVDFRLANHES